MKAINIIFGLIMIVFGIVCFFTPLKTAFSVNVLLAILAAAYGLFGFISCIAHKNFGLLFVFCILSIAFGVAVFFLPKLVTVTNTLVARLVAGWIILQGFVNIIAATQAKKLGISKRWVLQLIFGIIGICLGAYALVHPLVFGVFFAFIIGAMIGIDFIQSGIALAFMTPKNK